MNSINDKKNTYRFNDSLIKEIDLDIESPLRLTGLFDTYYSLIFHIDNNVKNNISLLGRNYYA